MMTAVRGWVEIDGEPSLQIPCPKSITLQGDRVSMRFRRGCPEADALLQGKKFAVGGSFVGTFEAKVAGPSGKLKPLGSFSVDEEDLKTVQLSAYYLENEKEAVTVDVVPTITGDLQISILPVNQYAASRDLTGKTVKVRCEYPNVVSVLDEAVDSLTTHVVTLEEEVFYYLKIRNSRIGKVSDRILWIEFDPDDVVKVPIPMDISESRNS